MADAGFGCPIRCGSVTVRPNSSSSSSSSVALCCFGSPAAATSTSRSDCDHTFFSSHRPTSSLWLRNLRGKPSATSKRCLATFASSQSGDNEVKRTNKKAAAGEKDSSISLRDNQRNLLDEIATNLAQDQYRNIVVVNGAGVSTSCGIPDFRTPGTGLYSKLEEYHLPYPEAIFELGYFRMNPQPFATLASEIWPGQDDGPKPSRTHAFLKVLQDRGMLRRVYTQNIDGLESLAGVSDEKLVECHGHFRSCSCTSPACRVTLTTSTDVADCRESYLAGLPHHCPECGSLSKPDVVFFGEELPRRFQDLIEADAYECDLLIVQGTSLLVNPVAAIPEWVGRNVPRLLLNRELVGDFAREESRVSAQRRKDEDGCSGRDVFLEGECDHGVKEICKLAGADWVEDLSKAHG